MTRKYKIIFFLSSLAVILMVGKFVFAQSPSGKGYFLEKNNNLYILDNLHINGYLAVEQDLSTATGKLGDVLIGNYLLLDDTKNFYFCEDIRVPKANTPLNKDCNSKMLIWKSDSLDVKSDRYQLMANKLAATNGTINFLPAAGKDVSTSYPVRLTGCFSNDGSDNCEKDELKSKTVYLNTLSPKSSNELFISAKSLKFAEINLGPFGTPAAPKNENNQYLCWRTIRSSDNSESSCRTANSGDKESGGEKWNFKLPESGSFAGDFWSGETLASSYKLCCHLKISF